MSKSKQYPLHDELRKCNAGIYNYDRFNSLVDSGKVDLNKIDDLGQTALHVAVDLQVKSAIIKLLDKNVELDIAATTKLTPLHSAVKVGFTAAVELLLNAGANPNITGDHRRTPLHDAARNGHLKIVELLLHKGADNRFDNYGNTPLHEACIQKRTEVIHKLLASKVDFVNTINTSSRKPIELLIIETYGYNFSSLTQQQKSEEFRNVTKEAIGSGDRMMVEVMLEFNANFDEAAKFLRQPNMTHFLYYACTSGNLDVVKVFLENGANINGRIESSHLTPLCAAIVEEKQELVSFLIQHGANVNTQGSSSSESPLHFAAKLSETMIARILLMKRADVNAKDSNGHTPMYNVQNKQMAQFLLEFGATVTPEIVEFFASKERTLFTHEMIEFLKRTIIQVNVAHSYYDSKTKVEVDTDDLNFWEYFTGKCKEEFLTLNRTNIGTADFDYVYLLVLEKFEEWKTCGYEDDVLEDIYSTQFEKAYPIYTKLLRGLYWRIKCATGVGKDPEEKPHHLYHAFLLWLKVHRQGGLH